MSRRGVEAELGGGGAEVDKFVGGAVEADYFPTHNISDFVAEFFVGEDIKACDIREQGCDVYVED